MNIFIDFKAENKQSFTVENSVSLEIGLSSLSVQQISAIKNMSDKSYVWAPSSGSKDHNFVEYKKSRVQGA